MKVNESNRTNNDEVIKELHHRIAELDGMLAEETRQLKEMTAQMEKTSLKKAIDIIMAQPPELHYPAYYADLLRTKGLEIPNSSDTISRQAAIDALSVGKIALSRVLDETDIVGTDREKYSWGLGLIESIIKDIEQLPSAEPESCEGCKHLGHWENEVECGVPSPCTCCKRRAEDWYER